LKELYLNNNNLCGNVPNIPDFCDFDISNNSNINKDCPIDDDIIGTPSTIDTPSKISITEPPKRKRNLFRIILIISGAFVFIILAILAIYIEYFRKKNNNKREINYEAPSETVNPHPSESQQSLNRNNSNEVIIDISKNTSTNTISIINYENTTDITDTHYPINDISINNKSINKENIAPITSDGTEINERNKNIPNISVASIINKPNVSTTYDTTDITNQNSLDNIDVSNSINKNKSVISNISRGTVTNETNSSFDKSFSSISNSNITENINPAVLNRSSIVFSPNNTLNTFNVINNTESIPTTNDDSKIINQTNFQNNNDNNYNSNVNNRNNSYNNSNPHNEDLPPSYNDLFNETTTHQNQNIYSTSSPSNVHHNSLHSEKDFSYFK
jgi:hypothetical protein